MSRVGRKPISVPKGVTLSIKEGQIAAKGPKGELKRLMPENVDATIDGDKVTFARENDLPNVRARHGLARALVQNMITGVATGFERKLEINGVGYRAETKGDTITLNLGFSHSIDFKLPKGVTAKVDKNTIILTSIDRELLGLTAAKVRAFRPPEPYKGKGIKYAEETIRRKVGKAGAA